MHREKQLFLSGYVDDYKMAGKAQNIPAMWKALIAAGLDLEPPVPLHSNVYLGCGQRELKVDPELVAAKSGMFQRLCASEPPGKPDQSLGNSFAGSRHQCGSAQAKEKQEKEEQCMPSLRRGIRLREHSHVCL